MDPTISLNFAQSALPSVIGKVVFFVGYAVLVVLLVEARVIEPGVLGGVGAALGGFLSVVTGLMLSLRSESSTSRWKEGRILWDSVSTIIRTFIRNVSLGLAPRESLTSEQCEKAEDLMGLIVAFPIALKHHLRGEKGVSYPDLEGLLPQAYISSLRRTDAPVRFAPHPIIKQIPSLPSSSSLYELPVVPPSPSSLSPSSSSPMVRRLSSALSVPGPSNLPLSILRLIHAYLDGLAKEGVLKPGVAEGTGGLVDGLTRALGGAERIRDTHVPLSISIHFQQMLSLYLLSIPPQLASKLRYWTIPVTAIAAFCFLGVDGIGATLGEPFGYHPSALQLDLFTTQILHESLELGGLIFVQGYSNRLSQSKRKARSRNRVVVEGEDEKVGMNDSGDEGADGEKSDEKEDMDGDEDPQGRKCDWDERRVDRWLPLF
ncbi:Bestrophin/UPF0187 [Phaffia rhodozyma]|uniref:Bestrophin/UPF0187 n=1 Tax=Phaffia rhodozyma TaxID=264483 RepID=A0A0F7SH88_PHARH|nr:Bestrophin/UPF0187 [Phaffia rhodozyma]